MEGFDVGQNLLFNYCNLLFLVLLCKKTLLGNQLGNLKWIRPIGNQSHLIQNQWLVATPKIKIRKMNPHTHTSS